VLFVRLMVGLRVRVAYYCGSGCVGGSSVTAMRNEGYSSASVSFELFRRYETSIATRVKYAAVGVSVMGALAALMWFVAESR
jgi:hypothetical protein